MFKWITQAACASDARATRSATLLLALALLGAPALAQTPQPEETPTSTPAATPQSAPESWGWHVQLTDMTQKHGSFNSPYAGANSLPSHESAKETFDATLFLGVRVWNGGEIYLNPELDQGFGLAGTLGVAGFTSGEAYKVGHDSVYGRLPRAFLRQTFALGEALSEVESDANQLAGSRPDDRITLTLGKFSVVDIFDTNAYAHDPRADFLNWSIIDGGAFDYAADSWGFTSGGAAEWTRGDWSLRGGLMAMSKRPNDMTIDGTFKQRQWIAEVERRYSWMGHPGAVRLLGFLTQARMASYADALNQAQASDEMPSDLAPLRQRRRKQGFVINAEQELAPDAGAFLRYSRNDGRTEAYDFTDINESVSGGLQVKGRIWGQPEHSAGLALARNGLSANARQYFATAGLGIVIGDGQLLHYATEQILEAYYNARLGKALSITADYQYVRNPAYNADRGPVSVFGLRIHAEY
ncbi:MAG: carbohydrate porin [Paucibacter sp.]|nr:carbohydrate porin [Roseateles sp.]